jgi:hypothetical protein
LDISLNTDQPNEDEVEDEDVTHDKIPDGVEEAIKFLERFKNAKIVIVIDTHSVENGAFVYDEGDEGIKTCYMLEVYNN